MKPIQLNLTNPGENTSSDSTWPCLQDNHQRWTRRWPQWSWWSPVGWWSWQGWSTSMGWWSTCSPRPWWGTRWWWSQMLCPAWGEVRTPRWPYGGAGVQRLPGGSSSSPLPALLLLLCRMCQRVPPRRSPTDPLWEELGEAGGPGWWPLCLLRPHLGTWFTNEQVDDQEVMIRLVIY